MYSIVIILLLKITNTDEVSYSKRLTSMLALFGAVKVKESTSHISTHLQLHVTGLMYDYIHRRIHGKTKRRLPN